MSRLPALAVLVSLLTTGEAATAAAPLVRITVEAGKHERIDTPVSLALQGLADPARPIRLEEVKDNQRIAVAPQVETGDAPALWWVLAGTTPAGGARVYELVDGPPPDALKVDVQVGKDALEIAIGGAKVLRYHTAAVQPPEGVDKKFARNAYIFPAWTPSGLVVTDDFPPDHRHQRGIWMSWTKTEFEGRHVDFWNIGDSTGAIVFAGMGPVTAGPVFGEFQAKHRQADLGVPGDKIAINEQFSVRVWRVGGPEKGYWLWDLVSRQRSASDSPVKLPQYYYGGLGYRGPPEWLASVDMLTSEGKTRKDGNETKARWCDVSGPLGGRTAGVLVMSHPQNFRHPEPVRLNPKQPQICFAPSEEGDWAIEPGKDYVWRYRFCVHDGEMKAAAADRLWTDFAEPPAVRIQH
jgi:hypothetical protein